MRIRGILGVRLALAALSVPVAGSTVLYACGGPAPNDCVSNSNCAAVDATTDSPIEGDALGMERDAADASPADGSDGDATLDTGAAIDAQMDAADGRDGFEGSVCDPTKSPHDEPCVVDNAYGVFVSASGRDGAAGTKSDPLRTITEGIARAVQTGKARLYLCDGAYAEQVMLSSPVSLYGALACDAGWSYAAGGAAHAIGAPNQVVLMVRNVGTSIDIEDVRFIAANASGQDDAGNGLSSIAALISASTVTFRRCAFSAGSGDNGASGGTSSNYGTATAPNGQPNDDAGMGGAGGSILCSNGTRSIGGNGGDATLLSVTDGGDGTADPMPPTNPGMGLDGLGGVGGVGRCSSGDNGVFGLAADAGVAATLYGVLTASGWTPSAGGGGQAGTPGQGGGGGGGRQSASPLGGTGAGAGGCGGAGGVGGAGGGASMAFACIASAVTLDSCVLTTSTAGRGGKGGDGQPGQGCGAPGLVAGPCLGGYGGNGAGGSGAAGGTGGISICVVYQGSAPVQTGGTSCAPGMAGAPGAHGTGGAGGNNVNNNPAPDGGNGADGLPGFAGAALAVQ